MATARRRRKELSTFDEALEHLKGRCYINVDKFWENVEEITGTIRRHGMADQILVKTAPDEAITDWLEQNAPEINYMLILSEEDRHSERMLRRHLNYVGVESLFCTGKLSHCGRKICRMDAHSWPASMGECHRLFL